MYCFNLCLWLECACTVRGAKASWAIVAGLSGAEVGTAAAAIGAFRHIIEVGSVAIRTGRASQATSIASQTIHTSNDGRGNTGASVDGPATSLISIVDRDARVRIGD